MRYNISTKDKGANQMEKDLNEAGSAKFYFTNDIPYAAIPKHYLMDVRLSLKGKGLLTIMYSLPEKWEYNMKGLARICKLSIKALRPTIKELETAGYVTRFRKQDLKGRFYYEYFITIEPYEFGYI